MKIVPWDNENYKIHGALTMRGVSKDIAFDAEVSEVIKDRWGRYKKVPVAEKNNSVQILNR